MACNESDVYIVRYVHEHITARTWRPVQARTVESYVSMLKGYLTFQNGCDVIDRAPRLKRMLTEMKHNELLGLTRR